MKVRRILSCSRKCVGMRAASISRAGVGVVRKHSSIAFITVHGADTSLSRFAWGSICGRLASNGSVGPVVNSPIFDRCRCLV